MTSHDLPMEEVRRILEADRRKHEQGGVVCPACGPEHKPETCEYFRLMREERK